MKRFIIYVCCLLIYIVIARLEVPNVAFRDTLKISGTPRVSNACLLEQLSRSIRSFETPAYEASLTDIMNVIN